MKGRWTLKFAAAFVFFALIVVPFKYAVDTCLPYTQSRLFSKVIDLPVQWCSKMEQWDLTSRAEIMNSQNGVGLLATAELPQESISFMDMFLMWKVPANFPLFLSRIPGSFSAAQQILLWVFFCSILVTIILQTIEIVLLALAKPKLPEESEEDIQAGLRRDAIRRLLPNPQDQRPKSPEFSKRPFKRD